MREIKCKCGCTIGCVHDGEKYVCGQCLVSRIGELEAIVGKLPERMASILFARHNVYKVDELTGQEHDKLSHRELNEVLRKLLVHAKAQAATAEGDKK